MSRIGFGLWAAMVLIVPLAGAQSYTIKDLGILGGSTFGATEAMNDRGAVVGGFIVPPGYQHAFLWNAKGGRQDLGTLPGDTQSSATAVNNAGQVVGYSEASNGFAHAFLWTQAEGMQDLGTLLGGDYSYAQGINESGVIVGVSTLTGDFTSHAFMWTQSEGMQDLGTLGGTDSTAAAINQSGTIVGSAYTSPDSIYFYAFLWMQAAGMQLLGAVREESISGGTAINASGQVFGYCTVSPRIAETEQAVSWSTTGVLKSLGAGKGSSVLGANDAGDAVGYGDNGRVAFLWTQANGYQDLNSLIPPNSGWNLKFAYGINQAGQIIASGTLNYKTHAALLTPVK